MFFYYYVLLFHIEGASGHLNYNHLLLLIREINITVHMFKHKVIYVFIWPTVYNTLWDLVSIPAAIAVRITAPVVTSRERKILKPYSS